jgi:hypothetical protein
MDPHPSINIQQAKKLRKTLISKLFFNFLMTCYLVKTGVNVSLSTAIRTVIRKKIKKEKIFVLFFVSFLLTKRSGAECGAESLMQ